jgi:hypothetical protein
MTPNQTTTVTTIAPARAKRDRGRPTKRGPETAKRILEALRNGNTLICAARVGRIDVSNLQKWRRADPQFDEAVKDAIGEAETKLVALATAGAAKDGRIALMMLERRHPEGWSKREAPQEHVHAHGTFGPNILAELVADRRRRDAQLLTAPIQDAEEV